jgi:hypothetical protein
MHNCRSLEDAAAATRAGSTFVRNRRLPEEEDFDEVDM